VATAMVDESPETMLEPILRVFENFSMPGTVIPGYLRRAIEMARAGVYNLRIHHDRVLVPLLRDWGIEHLTGLSKKAQELQERIMELPDRVMKSAERFEARIARFA
jgi:acyl-[acyl-carrier-protein] desaturase